MSHPSSPDFLSSPTNCCIVQIHDVSSIPCAVINTLTATHKENAVILKLHRFSFALAAAMAACVYVLPSTSAARAQEPLGIRMKFEDFAKGPDGAKRLASLEKAVAKMKSLDNSTDPKDFRRSWVYWANIHGYYGDSSPDGTVQQQIDYLNQSGLGKYVRYYQGVVDQTPPDAVAQTTWATCQHSGGQQSQQTPNFFLWHRMYLYYFEKVLQWASGDPTLRLPYWNYTDPAQVRIPAPFLDKNSALYDDKRDPGMNNGTSQLNPNSTNIDSLMRISDYLTFEFRIERGIHGYVHCAVGPTCPVAHMGDVPLAGNDPVFYSHHGNIDRLFACWETKYGIPSGDWSTQTFSFPDAAGNMVTKPVSDFLDTKALGYVYDNESACTRTHMLAATAAAAASAAPTVLAQSPQVAIDRNKVTVDIALPGTARQKMRGLAAAQPQPLSLELRDITAQAPPGVLLDVYIYLKSAPEKKQFVGTISWFNDFGVGHHHMEPVDKTVDFDITDQLKRLGAESANSVEVSIEASTGRVSAGRAPALRSEALTINPAAKMKVGSIEVLSGK